MSDVIYEIVQHDGGWAYKVDGVFSDACNKAIEFGKPVLMQPDWKKVFEPKEIADSIRRIT